MNLKGFCEFIENFGAIARVHNVHFDVIAVFGRGVAAAASGRRSSENRGKHAD